MALELGSEVQRRQRPLSDDHRVDEFHGHVLGVGGGGAAAEGQQPAAGHEPPRHLAARLRQPPRLRLEERLQYRVAAEELVANIT